MILRIKDISDQGHVNITFNQQLTAPKIDFKKMNVQKDLISLKVISYSDRDIKEDQLSFSTYLSDW